MMNPMQPVRVVVAGTFDGVHAGHLHLFSYARAHGRALEKKLKRKGVRLHVIVARDANVRKVKGRSPLHNERERMHLVRSLSQVDGVRLGHPTDFIASLEQLKPDVIVLGYDQMPGIEKVLKARGYDRIARATPYAPGRLKSTFLKKRKANEEI